MANTLVMRGLLLSVATILLTVCVCFDQAMFGNRLSDAALELTTQSVSYDLAYFKIEYPRGDAPANYN